MARPVFEDSAKTSFTSDFGSTAWDPIKKRPVDSEGEANRIWSTLSARFGISEPDPAPKAEVPKVKTKDDELDALFGERKITKVDLKAWLNK